MSLLNRFSLYFYACYFDRFHVWFMVLLALEAAFCSGRQRVVCFAHWFQWVFGTAEYTWAIQSFCCATARQTEKEKKTDLLISLSSSTRENYNF